MFRIGVLASHQGTNFQTVTDACNDGSISGTVSLLICNNSNAPVLQRAKNAGIPIRHLSSKTHPDPDQLDEIICDALVTAQTDIVVLAGYMKKLGDRVLQRFKGKIINVHPSLLPKHGGQGFYGMRVHEAVIDAGDQETGATVHLVTEEYDAGGILLQESIPVEPGDTADSISKKVQSVEHRLLVTAIQKIALETLKCQSER
jgi:phosphoribosylglycinamide formyltransferase-1